jgi:hypothetical protein
MQDANPASNLTGAVDEPRRGARDAVIAASRADRSECADGRERVIDRGRHRGCGAGAEGKVRPPIVSVFTSARVEDGPRPTVTAANRPAGRRRADQRGSLRVNTTKTALKAEGFIFGAYIVLPIVVALLVWFAGGEQRGPFNSAHIFTLRYPAAVIMLMLLLIPFFYQAKHRQPGAPLTWGEAAVAATYIFFLLFWLYGVVPHEFLNWADSELAWRPDKKVIGPDGSWASWWSFWKNIPLTIDLQKFRDVIATLLYVFGLGGLIWAFAFWNDREKKAAEAGAVEKVSPYGRPLVTKARG